MAHDVFVSYSNKDKPIADAVVAGLENKGIRCWIAPRDITPGITWGDAIISAIEGSSLMVIILSENSNRSKQVVREVERAVANNVIIIPFRIEDIDPTGAMAYFLSTEHWLDAITPPIEKHIEKLTKTILAFQNGEDGIFPQPDSDIKIKPKQGFPLRHFFIVFGILSAIILAILFLPKLFNINLPWRNAPPSESTSIPSITFTTSPTSTQTPTPIPTPAFSVLGNWLSSRDVQHVHVQDNLAYIANGGDGLQILDVSDQTNPIEIGSYPLDNAQFVLVVGDIAYVTDQGDISGTSVTGDRLIVLDIKIPQVPQLLGELSFGHRSINKLAVEDQTAYLTRSDKVIAVDVSNPAQMETIGKFSFFSNVAYPGVAVKDGIVYLLANKLHIVDFRNPVEPIEITSVDTGWGSSIILIDNTAYVTSWDEGLSILDISDPTKPVKLGRFTELVGDFEHIPTGAATRQTFMDASINGEIAFLSYSFGLDQGTGIQIMEAGIVAIDVSDPTNPALIEKYADFYEISSIFAVDDLIYVTDKTRGLFMLSSP